MKILRRDCGLVPQSRLKINEKLIRWADAIYVMEKRHKEIITQQFRNEIQGKTIRILFIPDEFELMDERLIEILKEKISV